MSSIFIINTMISIANHRARSHGGATSQRSKMNLRVMTFKTMVNTKKSIISKILSLENSPVLSVIKTASKKSRESDFERALYVICSDRVYYSSFFYGNRIILYSECLNPK